MARKHYSADEKAEFVLYCLSSQASVSACCKAANFYRWKKIDNEYVIRLVTSWATKEEIVEAFLTDIKKYKDDN